VALVGTFLALIGPVLLSDGYRMMVLGAKEMSWVYAQVFVMPRGLNILLCPAALVALILHFFSYRTITKDILILYTGLVFTLLLVLVTPMPGWTYWCLPFICYFLIRQELSSYLPFWAFTGGYLAYYLAFEPLTAGLGIERLLPADKMSLGRDASFTVMQTSLILMAAWVYRIGVRSYVQYKARSKTLALGIGGDSGAGKNTLADVLGGVVGEPNLVVLHGDDYHRWEREDEAWEGLTHLDPRSNYFSEPNEHILNLKNGIPIKRRRYDHGSGKFTDPEHVEPNNIVLFEGLHPFVFKRMRNVFDIKVFVNTEESLRRLWKVRRDSVERGYKPEKVLSEIERRMEDSEKFVRPQAKFADWVIEYEPKAEVDPLDKKGDPVELRVRHTVSSEVVEIEDLTEELRRRGGDQLRVQWSLEPSLERQVLSVEGELPADAVREIAYKVFPDLDEFLLAEPVWRAGVHGMNQLVFLTLYRWVVER
jgi:uridine kinase